MTLEETVQKFVSHPCLITNGAPSLSKKWGVDVGIVYQARGIAKDIIKNKEQFGMEYNPTDVSFIDLDKEGDKLLNEALFSFANTVKKVDNKLPKILIFDLETSPLKAWVWGKWDQNISSQQLISDWFLLGWSAKWLYSSETYSEILQPNEVLYENDLRIVTKLWDLIDQADILIAHNGNKFDVPRLNSRFIVNGLMPPSSYKTIDTLLVARSQFGFSSNKLDDLANIFGLGHKLTTGFELWSKCMQGDEESLKYMETYNRKDVELLEDVYLKLRPYIRSHPNAAVYVDSLEPMCSMCGSTALTEEGSYYTNTGVFQQYRCTCGALSRGRVNILSKDKKKNMLTAIPR